MNQTINMFEKFNQQKIPLHSMGTPRKIQGGILLFLCYATILGVTYRGQVFVPQDCFGMKSATAAILHIT